MRTGISLSVTPADLDRLSALVKDHNALQKHVWRAQILLLSAEGLDTNAIMRETGNSKTCGWHRQERFDAEGVEGLLRDRTRPSRIAKLDPSIAERVIALTMEEPPGETTHRVGAAMAKAAGVSVSSVQRIWRAGSSRIAPGSAIRMADLLAVARGRAVRRLATFEDGVILKTVGKVDSGLLSV